MKYIIADFMTRLTASEKRWPSAESQHESDDDSRLQELERENARLRTFVADLLLGRSA